MFGIGLPELILILIVALLVVGPKKLPELARSLGKALRDIRSMTDDVKQSFVGDLELEENPDRHEGKTRGSGKEKSEDQEKDGKATEPGTGRHAPENTKSDPYGDLRG